MFKVFLTACQRNLAHCEFITCKEIRTRYNSLRDKRFGYLISPTISIRTASRFVVGFSAAAVGCFGATKPNAGLNFKMSPHYLPNETYQNNLKAMVVAMMMTDCLDKDEVTFLLNAVDMLYSEEDENCKKRTAWCLAEMKNYMICAERYSSFQDERCKGYRGLLKNCLQAKKGASNFVPIRSSMPESDKPSTPKPCPAFRRRKPLDCDNCKQSVPALKIMKPSVEEPTIPDEDQRVQAPSPVCDLPVLPPNESCISVQLTVRSCDPPPFERYVPIEIAPEVCEPTQNECEPSEVIENVDVCNCSSTEPCCSVIEGEIINCLHPEPVPVCKADEPICIEVCCEKEINVEKDQYSPQIDDATVCALEYEEWLQKERCGCLR